ncbi:hypothetical protein [Fluviispira multicolorata]|uniref:Uncharacterized protein n=1 Tax=Fluviispira multicolorata TaxID=2654512 RepID=A0A833N4D5_9BACT|nr:hypothetical protein [Fluviispira multicolorata]KAB8031911.1 hypothetical protein GCL57_04505 [Fluviispira multicolorata]
MNDEDKTNLDNYASFIMSDGMILRELIEIKGTDLDELFSILGPKALIQEILSDKRKINLNQKKLLADFFGTNHEIFSDSGNDSDSLSELPDIENMQNDSSEFKNEEEQQNDFNAHSFGQDNIESSNISEEEPYINSQWQD